MAKIVQFERREKRLREIRLDALFQCVPAPSHEIIAQRMSKELKQTFPISHVSPLLNHLRKNKETYEWTIPHAARGPAGGENRFFAVLVTKGRAPQFDANAQEQLQLGSISTIATIYTSLTNQSSALESAQQYVPQASRRKLAALRRRLTFVAEEMGDLVEELRANGS